MEIYVAICPVDDEPGEGEGQGPQYAAPIQTEEEVIATNTRGRKRARAISGESVVEFTGTCCGRTQALCSHQRNGAKHEKSRTDENEYEWDDIYSAGADAGLTRGKGVSVPKPSHTAAMEAGSEDGKTNSADGRLRTGESSPTDDSEAVG